MTCVWRITDFLRISNSQHTGSFGVRDRLAERPLSGIFAKQLLHTTRQQLATLYRQIRASFAYAKEDERQETFAWPLTYLLRLAP
jgi:hypothetical protein